MKLIDDKNTTMEVPACAGMTASPEFITSIHHTLIPDQRIHSISKSDARCTFLDLRLQEDKNLLADSPLLVFQ